MIKRNPKREKWMADFEQALTTWDSRFAGRINWDAAIFHFNNGESPGLAAARFLQSETPKGLAWPHGAQVKS